MPFRNRNRTKRAKQSTYGDVHVAGQTLSQVKATIEAHLAKFLVRPEVSVVVKASRSKFYYVIAVLAGNGEEMVLLPATGNETVLDAIAQVGGLSAVSSKAIWIAQPTPAGTADQILPVDWKGISQRGQTRTNYQLLPGDRGYITGTRIAVHHPPVKPPLTRLRQAVGIDPVE